MATLQEITAEAQKIRKAHPRIEWKTAISQASKKLKGKKVAGVKVTVKTGTKKRKRVSGVKVGKVAKVGRVTKVGNSKAYRPKISGAIGAIGRAKKIKGGIDKLERELKGIKDRELKQLYHIAINAEHDKIDAIKRSLKK